MAVVNADASLIEDLPPSRMDGRLARIAIWTSLLGLGVMTPFAQVKLPHVPAFIPAYEAALAINDLITAVLLYTQAVRTGRRSVLFAASAYLYCTIVIIGHALSFPGVFAPAGLLGGDQVTAWLYIFWHFGFPVAILGYAFLAGSRWDAVAGPGRGRAVGAAVLTATLLALTAISVCTLGEVWLPVLVINGDYSRVTSLGISPAIVAVTVAGIVSLRHRRTVLDIWLHAVLWVWLADVSLSAIIGSVRFDLGWYGGRLFGFMAATFVLISLLVEANKLYARLAASLALAGARNTELVQSRSELARAQRMDAVGQLTAGVAHDFNNLLTAILGALDMIVRKPGDQQRVVQLAGHASRAALRGARLVSQLMTFSRQQNLNPETIDPNTTLREFETLATHPAGASVRLVFSLGAGVPAIRVDTSEFQAAILNLVTNARDASPDQGIITIATRMAHDRLPPHLPVATYVVVSVTDRGMGMSAETQAKAFEPFFTTKPVGAGTGLGLSQVYGFAHSAGGAVVITSSLGKGTTVELFFPQATAHAPAMAHIASTGVHA